MTLQPSPPHLQGASSASPAALAEPDIAGGTTLLLAAGAGLGAAALYYNQPMLGALATAYGATAAEVGRVPMLTQLGYALGIVLLSPIGDRFDRRRLIVLKSGLLALALLSMASSRSLEALCVCSVAVGLAATLAQDCVPAAAALARIERRGRVIGRVMTGLLLGVLLSRVVSGAVTQAFGFRAMFALGAAAVLCLGAVAAWRLPPVPPTTELGYGALLRSLVALWWRHPALRQTALAQGLLSVAFGAFWSTLAVVLAAPPFGYGSQVAGAFGLAGAAGALAAPLAGGAADRVGPRKVAPLGIALVLACFALFYAFPDNLLVLVAGTVLFDLGTQVALVAHQSIVYALEPPARSRLNAILVSMMFLGMAAGAWFGAWAAHGGLRGVAQVAMVSASLSFAVRLLGSLRRRVRDHVPGLPR